MSINAYKRTLREIESPRQIERRVLASITGQLEDFADRYDEASSSFERITVLHSGLRKALTDNQKFWQILKYDLSESGNALSPELRAGLLSLAIWVEKTTASVLGGDAGVRALINVNANIVTALSEQPMPLMKSA
ncbi:flaF protein [Pseudooceanicola lipolyticus]|uniref:FlaF protein n=1 Tax=Pseudooceanicola lipolyticus TaxID=2029104 RepID=A0A2M8IXC5_9RHOB|nr:flagellar biosynthesis regulator FlaF [Pseudooceanicola lipolyticus]PJE35193.1 flaF protein [Pseudooceanicola lipolyticus]